MIPRYLLRPLGAAGLIGAAWLGCADPNENFFDSDPVLLSDTAGSGGQDPDGGAGGTRGGSAGVGGGGAGGQAAGGTGGSADMGGDGPDAGPGAAGGSSGDAGPDAGGPSDSVPVVDAGPDREGAVGETLVLDGFSASDADGDELSISWAVVASPAGSVAEVDQPVDAPASFTPDVAGTYTLFVTVNDGVSNATDSLDVTVCGALVDVFPVSQGGISSSLFSDLDDDAAQVPFELGFQFTFFGVTHDSLFLNTNGGITFGAGNAGFEEAASAVPQPTVAPFWGDHDVEATSGGADRADQLRYRQCPDRFTLFYQAFQSLENPNTDDTATVELFADGSIVIEYGTVDSTEILAGVFDGTHASDQTPNSGGSPQVDAEYSGYSSTGTGVILFDHFGAGPSHGGELSGRTVTFTP